MSTTTRALLGVVPAALIVTAVASKDDGYMPSGTGSGTSMTRTASNTCHKCHGGSAGFGETVVSVTPSARVLDTGQSISIRVEAENSRVPSGQGGFAADVTRGALVAGSGTKVRGDGLAITHSNDGRRTWTFNYRAPAQAGVVAFYTVGMTADGDGRNGSGDKHAFFGADPSSTTSTPVHLYVNAPGVTAVGEGCTDGYGNQSVLGASTTPTVGGPVQLEAYGVPPSSRALLMMGVGKATPGFDMKPMGAPGCVLYTTLQLQLPLMTTAGSAPMAEGRVTLGGNLPNDPNLRGIVLSLQLGVLDGHSQRPFPLLVTNAIEMKIQ